MKRRQFLRHTMAASMVGGIDFVMRPTSALANGTGSRRFVSIQLPGAPPRWMYDYLPAAYGAAGLDVTRNASIATNYASNGGRYTAPEYSTVSVKGLNVPPFWQQSVPAAGGGLRPVDGLLDHLLSLQGVNTAVDGHETCQRLHWQPVAGLQSRLAMAADSSSVPLPAVALQTSTFAFQSVRDKSVVPLAELEDNPLTQLLRPFLTPFPMTGPDLQARLGEAGRGLDANARAWARAAAETEASQSDALALFSRSFGDLDAIYGGRRAVYQDLIARALSPTLVIPGLTDLPVGTTGSRDRQYTLGIQEGSPAVALPDLRETFVAGTNIPGLAEQFVVIEYLLKEDLSRSVAIGAPPLSGLGGQIGEQVFDEHGTGVMISLLLNMKWYTAFSACLLELLDQLKAANIFDDTIIEVSGEFGRSALPEGEGSDHGWPGKITSFYGGRIQGPVVLGNVYATPPSDAGFSEYPGTWGFGAPVEGAGSILGLNHELATLAAMLGVESPTNAVRSVVSVNSSGRIVPAPGIERARIVTS